MRIVALPRLRTRPGPLQLLQDVVQLDNTGGGVEQGTQALPHVVEAAKRVHHTLGPRAHVLAPRRSPRVVGRSRVRRDCGDQESDGKAGDADGATAPLAPRAIECAEEEGPGGCLPAGSQGTCRQPIQRIVGDAELPRVASKEGDTLRVGRDPRVREAEPALRLTLNAVGGALVGRQDPQDGPRADHVSQERRHTAQPDRAVEDSEKPRHFHRGRHNVAEHAGERLRELLQLDGETLVRVGDTPVHLPQPVRGAPAHEPPRELPK
mmetsp:Transcript_1575/g.4292  ORF Transcript_1575/g.4292 Transcript_1575/m.4292 type:complete len:265 (+) Transcript_1575:715-1509(+)